MTVPPGVINPGKLVIHGPQQVTLHPGQVVLQLLDVFVIFLLSAVSVAPFLFHPPVILKEFVCLEEKVDDIEVPSPFKLCL
jgi:hypothetical protein